MQHAKTATQATRLQATSQRVLTRQLALCAHLDTQVPVMQGRVDAAFALKGIFLQYQAMVSSALHAMTDITLQQREAPHAMCVSLAMAAQAPPEQAGVLRARKESTRCLLETRSVPCV